MDVEKSYKPSSKEDEFEIKNYSLNHSGTMVQRDPKENETN